MIQFEKGKEYIRVGLFGPSWWVRVMERTEKTVTFAQVGYEHEPPTEWTTIEVQVDTDGTEMCECWEYMGHKGYIRADSRF